MAKRSKTKTTSHKIGSVPIAKAKSLVASSSIHNRVAHRNDVAVHHAMPINLSRVTWESLTGLTAKEIVSRFDQATISQVYCNMFFHPLCGGIPQFYTDGHVTCTGCIYRIKVLSGNEPLGGTLLRSEFRIKKEHPTFLY